MIKYYGGNLLLIRNKPRLKYSGLTIVLSNPSRFDTINLLSGNGGHLLNEHCLRPEYNVMQCDVRLAEDTTPFLEGTKCILCLGEFALHTLVPESRDNSLGEVRGSVYYWNNIPVVASFFPQDAVDMRNHEAANNPLSKDYTVDDENEDDENSTEDFDSVKRHGRTKRSNYAFWLRQDVARCKHILQFGIPISQEQPVYKTYPNSNEVIDVLMSNKDRWLYFDIETDYEEQSLQCFSFSFDGRVVYNVPVLDYNYKPAYSRLSHILRALAFAIRDNTIVSHNGANFDFFVLGWKYRIPVYRCYDTMVAHHRCWPDVDKSLGHAVSHLTWELFHKDEDSQGYMSQAQMDKRLAYCGKDVRTMALVHKAIETHAKKIPGLQHSIDTANASIVPYLTATLQGIQYNERKFAEICKENDALMTQYLRIINILIGPKSLPEVKASVKGKAKGFPGSNTQCCHYFHEMLGYTVVARSKKTGKPSLGKKAMFKLALQHANPVIQFVLAYRTLAKEYGTLKFIPFRDNNNQIINTAQYDKILNPTNYQPSFPFASP